MGGVWWSKADDTQNHSSCKVTLPRDCNCLLTKCFMNVNWSSQSTVAENLELCFWANVRSFHWGQTKQKLWKSRFLERFCSDSFTSQRPKSNQHSKERPIGLRASQMLSDLRLRARGLVQVVAPERVHAGARARMHNWSIWCQSIVVHNRLCDCSLKTASCAQGTNRPNLKQTLLLRIITY